MFHLAGPAVAGLVLLAAPPVRPPDARALVEKAVRAAGGADRLAKSPAATWKGRGTFFGAGGKKGTPFTLEGARQGADRLRLATKSTFRGTTYERVLVVDGKRGWTELDGRAQGLPKDELAEQRERMYANYVASLVPLLREGGFTLAPLGPARVGEREALGVKVARKGRRDVLLFFDATTGRLLKRESAIKDLPGSGKDVKEEVLYEDYRPTPDGALHARKVKVLWDGKRVSEVELTSISPRGKLDDALFAPPGDGGGGP
jgi:hypothetical protein